MINLIRLHAPRAAIAFNADGGEPVSGPLGGFSRLARE